MLVLIYILTCSKGKKAKGCMMFVFHIFSYLAVAVREKAVAVRELISFFSLLAFFENIFDSVYLNLIDKEPTSWGSLWKLFWKCVCSNYQPFF